MSIAFGTRYTHRALNFASLFLLGAAWYLAKGEVAWLLTGCVTCALVNLAMMLNRATYMREMAPKLPKVTSDDIKVAPETKHCKGCVYDLGPDLCGFRAANPGLKSNCDEMSVIFVKVER